MIEAILLVLERPQGERTCCSRDVNEEVLLLLSEVESIAPSELSEDDLFRVFKLVSDSKISSVILLKSETPPSSDRLTVTIESVGRGWLSMCDLGVPCAILGLCPPDGDPGDFMAVKLYVGRLAKTKS